MKMDYLFWVVAVLLLGLAAFRAARSPERPREGIVWLCGALIGIAADLPSHLTWGADAGRLGWSAAALLQAIAGPLPYLATDLTFPLWGPLTMHVGLLGLWVVIALVGCLYHGPLAVWLGRVYRRRPARAVAIIGGILVLHVCAGMLWQSYTIQHSQVERQSARGSESKVKSSV